MPGETVSGGDFRVTGGGKGANQAVAAARAGAPVVFVTALGTDDFGDRAAASLAAEGIDLRFARRVSDAPSGIALILVDDAGENVIAVAPGANAALRPEDVEPIAATLDRGDVVLVQLEIPPATVEATAQIVRRCGARLILNPAPARPLTDALLGTVAVITPNEHEAAQLGGDDGGAGGWVAPLSLDPERAAGWSRAAARLHQRGVPEVLITLGAAGVYVSGPGTAARIPAFAVGAVDTTAAGDVFNGAVAVALIEGRSAIDAARFGCAAAALSVTRPGARESAPRRVEIDAWLARHSAPATAS